jgi:uncharacterized repeat protein (TIGR03803 family)
MLAGAMASPAQQGQASPDAVKFKSLFSFDVTNGQIPSLNLVQGFDGNLYGTTVRGGSSDSVCEPYCGVFFRLTPEGAETTLYDFCSQPSCLDGATPNTFGSLTLGPSGNLYGTTQSGGANGEGTIFKITPAGALSVLYTPCGSSCGNQGDAYPGLVRGADGNFYGVMEGGVNGNPLCSNDPYGTCGIAYRVTPGGAFSVIYTFCSLANCADGAVPMTQLISGIDGNLYGTTARCTASALQTASAL